MNEWVRIGECQRCGACCLHLWYEFPKKSYNVFWEKRGAEVFTDPFNPDNVIVGVHAPCQHIHRNEDGTTRCDIYGTDEYPETCRLYPPERGPSDHFKCIKKTLGCGFDYITKEKEERKMTVSYELEKEEADRLQKVYGEKAHEIYESLLREAGVPGTYIATAIFRDLVQESERKATNLVTIDRYNDEWTDNFKTNLLGGEFKGFESRWITDVMKADTFLCVGAGASLTDEQIDAMKEFGGTIICVNKSAKRLYERGVVPDIVTCIHGTNEVMSSFTSDVVRNNLQKSHVVLATSVPIDVVQELKGHCDHNKLWFFHSSVPSDLITNLDNFFQAMFNVPVIDTGGNVGLFNIALTQQFGPKAVGFVGMDLCQSREEAIKKNEHMLESTLLWFPEDDQEFVLSKVFRGYTQVMMNWYGEQLKMNDNKFPYDLINCTPRGLIYIRRKEWIPYMPIEEFISKYSKKKRA